MKHKDTAICINCGHPIVFYISGFSGKWKHFDGVLNTLWVSDSCRNAGNSCALDCIMPEVSKVDVKDGE